MKTYHVTLELRPDQPYYTLTIGDEDDPQAAMRKAEQATGGRAIAAVCLERRSPVSSDDNTKGEPLP